MHGGTGARRGGENQARRGGGYRLHEVGAEGGREGVRVSGAVAGGAGTGRGGRGGRSGQTEAGGRGLNPCRASGAWPKAHRVRKAELDGTVRPWTSAS